MLGARELEDGGRHRKPFQHQFATVVECKAALGACRSRRCRPLEVRHLATSRLCGADRAMALGRKRVTERLVREVLAVRMVHEVAKGPGVTPCGSLRCHSLRVNTLIQNGCGEGVMSKGAGHRVSPNGVERWSRRFGRASPSEQSRGALGVALAPSSGR